MPSALIDAVHSPQGRASIMAVQLSFGIGMMEVSAFMVDKPHHIERLRRSPATHGRVLIFARKNADNASIFERRYGRECNIVGWWSG